MEELEIKKFEFLEDAMSNWNEVESYIISYNKEFPLESISINTIGIKDEEVLLKLLQLSEKINKLNIVFDIHDAFEEDRDESNLSLRDIRNFGLYWSEVTGRYVNINYHVTNNSNKPQKIDRLMDLFDPDYFHFILSGENQTLINVLSEFLTNQGYKVK